MVNKKISIILVPSGFYYSCRFCQVHDSAFIFSIILDDTGRLSSHTDHWWAAWLSYLFLLFFGTLHSDAYVFPFLLCFSLLFFSQLFVRPLQTAILLFCIPEWWIFIKKITGQKLWKNTTHCHKVRESKDSDAEPTKMLLTEQSGEDFK